MRELRELRRKREITHLSNPLLKSKVHYAKPEIRMMTGAENLMLFAKSKLPKSADAAFKEGIPTGIRFEYSAEKERGRKR